MYDLPNTFVDQNSLPPCSRSRSITCHHNMLETFSLIVNIMSGQSKRFFTVSPILAFTFKIKTWVQF